MKTLTVRIPDDLLNESNEVLEQIGLDVPTALRVFLTQVAATRSIPFALKAREVPWEVVPVDGKTQSEMALDHRVCLATIYSCGLRLGEGLNIQIPTPHISWSKARTSVKSKSSSNTEAQPSPPSTLI